MFMIGSVHAQTNTTDAQTLRKQKIVAPTTGSANSTKSGRDNAAKKPAEKLVTECDAGDSKCMENKANIETKPTDGAIQREAQ